MAKKKEEEEGLSSHCALQELVPSDQKTPTRSHLLKVSQPPRSATLGTTPLTQGLCGTEDPRCHRVTEPLCTWASAGSLLLQVKLDPDDSRPQQMMAKEERRGLGAWAAPGTTSQRQPCPCGGLEQADTAPFSSTQ